MRTAAIGIVVLSLIACGSVPSPTPTQGGQPHTAVTASIRGEYHPNQSFSMRAGSTVAYLSCPQVEAAFQPSMKGEEFKKALAALGFDAKVVDTGVNSPCDFASMVPTSQLTTTAIGSAVKIDAIATGSKESCTISQIRISGCP